MTFSDRIILSVVGSHANEGMDGIFSRKIFDIENTGETLWLCHSPGANPDRVKKFFGESAVNVLFVSPVAKNGSRPTTSACKMTEFSKDKINWYRIPDSISPVTGNPRGTAYALIIRSLSLCGESKYIDLWEYLNDDGNPVRFRIGLSTVLARRGESSSLERSKSRFRKVVAIGVLSKPYVVWVRS